jgi:hypothetical protein
LEQYQVRDPECDFRSPKRREQYRKRYPLEGGVYLERNQVGDIDSLEFYPLRDNKPDSYGEKPGDNCSNEPEEQGDVDFYIS